jgi:hypothetical protein
MNLKNFAFNQFKQIEIPNVVQWAETNGYLSERITEQAGIYSTTGHPYVREVLENFANPNVKHVSLCWGSQTGKTTTLYMGVGFTVDQKPAPILMVYPTEHVARTFSNDRLMPFLTDTKCLQERMPKNLDGKIDQDKVTTYRMEFDRCSINLVGGGSRANVRNYPVSVLVLDEIDVISEQSRRECLDRVKGRRDWKVFQSSTPLDETSGIWGEFLNGDQRQFEMPCPHCNEFIAFEWKTGDKFNLRCDKEKSRIGDQWMFEEVEKTTFYFCQKCDKPINDKDKFEMMQSGKWVAQSQSQKGFRSYHLSSLYSPTLRFSDVLIKWQKAQDEVEGVKNFVQGWLARPWTDEIMNVSIEKIEQLVGDHERGEMKGDFRILSVDVQRSHFWFVVRGFNRDGSSWLIDHGLCPTFDELDQMFKEYDCRFGIIDTGYGDRAQEVYEQIFHRRANWFGVKGWANMATPYKVNLIDPFSGTGKQGKTKIKLVHLDVTVWQGELGQRRAGRIKGWHLYKNPCLTYLKQLASKWQHETINRKGEKKVEWRVKSKADDHLWDCETYALAFSKLVGLGKVASSTNDSPRLSRGGKTNGGKSHAPVGQFQKSFWK